MCSSNIVAGSNVYLVRTDYPYYDPDFVKQIQDYELLKFIKQRKKIDDSVEFPFGNQGAILKSEMRCINAKSDPCFGYDQVQKIMVCDCINGDCPQITKCNPEYSKDYAKLWDTSNDEKKLYGDPKKLALFYLVDLTSDNEKNEYYADPGNDGIDYPTTPAPILPDDKVVKEEIIYIDPKTGKKLEIIGYNKLKYPEEDGIGEPIWGVVGEYSYDKNLSIIRKSKPIEKIEEPSKIEEFYNNIEYKNVAKKTEISSKIDFEYKKKIENSVLELIIKDIKLIDIENETFELSNTVILFDNPAEMAFVSSNLLIKDVNFGMDDDSNLVLSLVDNYNNYIDRTNVIISNNADDVYDLIAEGVDKVLADEAGDDETGISLRLLIWNMLTVAFSDSDYSDLERRLLKHIVRTHDVEKDVFLEMEQLMKTNIAVSMEIDEMEGSEKSYAEIRPIVEELEERRQVILNSAKALIEDEMYTPVTKVEIPKNNMIESAKNTAEKVSENVVNTVAPIASNLGNQTKKLFGSLMTKVKGKDD